MNQDINRLGELYRQGGLTNITRGILDTINVNVLEVDRRTTAYHRTLLDGKTDLAIAEVGVWRGKHAKSLAYRWDIDTFYLIDPYNPHSLNPGHDSKIQGSRWELSKVERTAKKRLKNVEGCVWIKKRSDEAIRDIDQELDYVYIDGDHSYEVVKKDIPLYYELLKDGGILSGHDSNWEGVSRALMEFCCERDIVPRFETNSSDWWIQK